MAVNTTRSEMYIQSIDTIFVLLIKFLNIEGPEELGYLDRIFATLK